MKTSLAIAVIACLVLTGSVWSQSKNGEWISEENNAGHPHPDKKTEANQKKSPSSAPIENVQPIPAQDQGNTAYFDYSKHNQEKNDDSDLRLVRVTVWLAIAGFIQAVILAVQAVLFFQQKKIMGQHKASFEQLADVSQKVLTLSGDTAERQLRAYICVSGALLKFKGPTVPEAQVHYSNYGQTPAYDVRSWIHMWIERHPLRIELPEPSEGFQMSTTVIAPGARPHFHVIEKRPPIPEQAVSLLGTTEGTIYVYGEIRYRDIFKKERVTKYRLIYGGPSGGRKVPDKEEWLLNTDTEGNEAT